MRSLEDIGRDHSVAKPDGYLSVYERFFAPLRSANLSILELGIYDGGSLKTWEAYFPYARIAGLDARPAPISVGPRVRLFQGQQSDVNVLARVAAEIAPGGFDIIIDDCAHIAAMAKASFWYLFDRHLKPGGLYAVEDWGTGYWPTWPDGRKFVQEPDSDRRFPSHDGGMVGFIKQLVDEVSAPDIRDAFNAPPPRDSKFAEMTLVQGICIIRKAMPPSS